MRLREPVVILRFVWGYLMMPQINKEINGSIFLHRLIKSYNFKLLRYFVVHIIIHPPGEENIW